MTLLIALKGWDHDDWRARFQAALPDREIVTAEMDYDPNAVRYACVWKAPHGLLATLPNLDVIFSLGAGVDHILSDPERPDRPIVRGVSSNMTMRMTEWIVLQVLLQHRQQHAYDAFQRDRVWDASLAQPAACDVRIGVMGLGVLGGDAAEKLSRLGFDVAGWSRSPKDITGVTCYAGDDGLTAFLKRTDILVCLLPDTPGTRGILNRDLFQKLAQDGALPDRFPVLINAGRGALQVEADIIASLNASELKGATLDVFETEPLPQDSPLWTHPRVIVTPHVAADSEPHAFSRYVAGQIVDYEAGKPLRNVVDLTKGY
ncbi:MAG: glyoxylate/hydroxypyruvate reductase A [Pseudomonadota bacterium]